MTDKRPQMQSINADDIYILNVRGQRSVWLHHSCVIDICKISDEYMWKVRSKYRKSISESLSERGFLPDTGKAWRWGHANGSFWYALANIPNRAPKFYRRLFPTEAELLAMFASAELRNEYDVLYAEITDYIEQHHADWFAAVEHNDADKREALARVCALLDYSVKALQRGRQNAKKYKFFKQLSRIVREIGLKHVPTHPTRLKEKVLAAFNGTNIAELVKPKNIGNRNAALFDDNDTELVSWIYQLRGMDANFSDAYIVRKIRDTARTAGKRVPSVRWIGSILESQEVQYLAAEARHGRRNHRSWRHGSYVPLRNALYAGDCWQVDGTRVNFVAHKTKAGTWKHLYIIAVRDVHSGDLLGWSLDYKEDRWSVISALQSAVKFAGYLPFEIIFDRFPGHNSPEGKDTLMHLQRLGVRVSMAHEATGKARMERGFGTLQTVFMQDSPYYYGEGVTSSRPAAHRSPEYLNRLRKKARKEGWDFTASVNEAERVIENYRHTALNTYSKKYAKVTESPAQLHEISEKPNVQKVNEVTISLLFGFKKEITLTHNGLIQTDILKTTHYFQIDNFEIISQNKTVIISYDLDDLSRVYLLKRKGDFLTFLGEAKAMNPVQTYGPSAEWGRLQREKSRIAALEEQRKAALAEKQAAYPMDLLMGRFTDKDKANEAETELEKETARSYKKASGGYDSIENDDIDIDITKAY